METGKTYHVSNTSIGDVKIFVSAEDYSKIMEAIRYFSHGDKLPKLSQFSSSKKVKKMGFQKALDKITKKDKELVDVLCYLILPSEFHLILKQKKKEGISKFMSDVSNSYSRYFNNKYKRRGPLWVGRFKRVLIKENQLESKREKIHNLPAELGLVSSPDQWLCSSYREYTEIDISDPICKK